MFDVTYFVYYKQIKDNYLSFMLCYTMIRGWYLWYLSDMAGTYGIYKIQLGPMLESWYKHHTAGIYIVGLICHKLLM